MYTLRFLVCACVCVLLLTNLFWYMIFQDYKAQVAVLEKKNIVDCDNRVVLFSIVSFLLGVILTGYVGSIIVLQVH